MSMDNTNSASPSTMDMELSLMDMNGMSGLNETNSMNSMNDMNMNTVCVPSVCLLPRVTD